jgi:guanosine-3',5'-bis(diphosphate) 3'-pyrophosphohydrolase
MKNLELRALDFATAAHKAHVRKHTGEPYINHPIVVASIVRFYGFDEETIAAAYLHDVVEDCPITVGDIEKEFGGSVASKVSFLTALKPPGMNRATRKALYRTKLEGAPGDVHSIKLADILHNAPSIIAHDPDLAKIWIPESKELVAVLVRGHPALINKVTNIVTGYEAMQLTSMA